jgi:hypothetical protein
MRAIFCISLSKGLLFFGVKPGQESLVTSYPLMGCVWWACHTMKAVVEFNISATRMMGGPDRHQTRFIKLHSKNIYKKPGNIDQMTNRLNKK